MYHIDHIRVEGFWETVDFDVPLRDVNFLIGQNGTGKTTLINLIAAALTADFFSLDRIPFKQISIVLDGGNLSPAPAIIVKKERRQGRSFDSITYRIRPGGKNAEEMKFSLDETQEQLIIRRYPRRSVHLQQMNRRFSGLTDSLRSLVSVNWLSIHRFSSYDYVDDEKSFESTIDRKIDEISIQLTRLLSTLSARKDKQVAEFQESIFLTLLVDDPEASPADTADLEKIDEYKGAIESIFSELHVERDSATELLRSFVDRSKRLYKQIKSHKKNAYTISEISTLTGLRRVSTIVKRWNKLQEELDQIFSEREAFVETVNSLFQRKAMKITASNELTFVSRSGKPLTANLLSSGEKQLLILLSETLLQRKSRAVLIADEPELSLHVLWQERLIESILRLNPSVQIIAATHSPDIVGSRASDVIDMESLIP